MATKKETAKAVKMAKEISNPQLPPYEDIIVNLGFWITMAQRAGQMIVQNKLKTDGLSQSDTNTES